MDPSPDDNNDEQGHQGGIPLNLEVLRSYLTFAKNAILGHKVLVALVVALSRSRSGSAQAATANASTIAIDGNAACVISYWAPSRVCAISSYK